MRRIRECHDGLFEGELSHRVIGTFYDVYHALGFGFLESVYRKSLAIELTRRGFHVAAEVPAEVRYGGQLVGTFRADLLIESRVVLELKASQKLTQADEMQVLNYLRATDLELGILLHFGPKPAFRRFVSTRPPVGGADSRSSASFVSSASAGLRASTHARCAATQPGDDTITAAPPHAPGPRPGPPPAAYRSP